MNQFDTFLSSHKAFFLVAEARSVIVVNGWPAWL
jgi:hypothetical protein